ncbi:MAG: FtsX-like permease family protein [Ilumatobacteraceae bacterium]
MFKLSLKNIWSRKGRLLLTAIAVIAGTAFLSGVFVFTDTIKGSFNEMFASAFKNTDAYVRSSSVIEGDFGEETRDHIDASLIDQVAAVPGVSQAFGDVNGTATVTFEDTVLGQDGPPKFAGAWIESDLSPWDLYDGRGATAPGEVVLDRASSKAAKVQVGDTVSITTRGAPQEFTVVGVARFAGADTSGGASWALFSLPQAQEFVIGDTGKVDSIVVLGDGSVDDALLADTIEQAIGGQEVEVLTGKEVTAENQSAVEKSLSFITVFLAIFALIAMFVGSFIIYNVFTISAAQRQRENALLRAVGASRSQITRSMFTEAFVVGIGGSLLGCIAGIGLATVILSVLNAIGFGPGDTSLVLHPTGFIVTMIIGVIVTVLCAIVPALRSGRVPPLAAMRDVAIDHSDVSRARKIAGAVAIASAVGFVALGLSGNTNALGAGVIALFVALIALGPFLATPVAKASSKLLTKLSGPAGTMASRNAARNPKGTAITAGALAVGLSLMIGVATLGASAKATARDAIGKAFESDYVVSPVQQNAQIGLPDALVTDLKATDVGSVLALGVGIPRVENNGKFNSYGVLAVDPADAAALLDLPFESGGFESLAPGKVLVAKDKAERDDIVVGDEINFKLFSEDVISLKVAGIFDSKIFGNFIVDPSLFETAPLLVQTRSIYINVDGASGDARAALDAVAEKYPTIKLQSRSEYIDEQSGSIDGFLNFIYALLGMSIFIAIIGIVITLMLAVYERRRELGLLRAVGTTRRQVMVSVLWESMITAVIGVIMGVVLGTALGWIIVKALEDQGLNVFSLPMPTIVVASLGALVLAAIAALYPSRKASKADILQAIATT